MKTIHLQVLSPEKTLYEGEVTQVTLPGTLGQFTCLPGHAPLVSSLEKGVVSFAYNPSGNAGESTERFISIRSGFAEIKQNKMVVCVEKVEKQA